MIRPPRRYGSVIVPIIPPRRVASTGGADGAGCVDRRLSVLVKDSIMVVPPRVQVSRIVVLPSYPPETFVTTDRRDVNHTSNGIGPE